VAKHQIDCEPCVRFFGWEAAIAPSGVSHGKVRPHARPWGKLKCGPLNGN